MGFCGGQACGLLDYLWLSFQPWGEIVGPTTSLPRRWEPKDWREASSTQAPAWGPGLGLGLLFPGQVLQGEPQRSPPAALGGPGVGVQVQNEPGTALERPQRALALILALGSSWAAKSCAFA